MESGPNFAHLEALLKLCSTINFGACILVGAQLLVFGWVPRACGRMGYALKLTLAGVFFLFLALVSPIMLGFMAAKLGDIGVFAGLIIVLILALFSVTAAVATYFLPTIFAIRHKKKAKVPIIVMNVFSFIPFCWLGSYVWSCLKDKPADSSDVEV